MKLTKLHYWIPQFPGNQFINVYFKTEKLKKHKLNHYEADQNRKISLFSLLTGEHEMTREMKYMQLLTFHSK